MAKKYNPLKKLLKRESPSNLSRVEGYRRGTEGAPRGPNPHAGNRPVKATASTNRRTHKEKKSRATRFGEYLRDDLFMDPREKKPRRRRRKK